MEKTATLVMLQPPTPAREFAIRIHAPSQSLMQPPLPRSLTPAASRKVSRFFRVRVLCESPRFAGYSAYFGWAKFCLSQPFRPSMDAILIADEKMSMPNISAIATMPVSILRIVTATKASGYSARESSCPVLHNFFHKTRMRFPDRPCTSSIS